MKIFTSYIHGTLYQSPKTSFLEFLNLPLNMAEFQPIPISTKFSPGINQKNLEVLNPTSVTSSWTELSQLQSLETKIFSSDIKDPMMISRFIQNGHHICQLMGQKASVHLLQCGNENIEHFYIKISKF